MHSHKLTGDALQIGVYLRAEHPAGTPNRDDEMLDLIVAAEDLGYASVHIAPFDDALHLTAPFALLATAAERTRRMRLRTTTRSLSSLDDVLLADLLLDRRIELGVEAALLPQGAGPCSAAGPRGKYSVSHRSLWDALPAEIAHDQLWLHARSTADARIAAQHGFGVTLNGTTSPGGSPLQQQMQLANIYRELMHTHRQPPRIAVVRTVYPATRRDRVHPQEMIPDLVVEQAMLGWTELLLDINLEDLAYNRAVSTLEQFAHEIAPYLISTPRNPDAWIVP